MESFLKVIGHDFCDITLQLDSKPIRAHKVRPSARCLPPPPLPTYHVYRQREQSC